MLVGNLKMTDIRLNSSGKIYPSKTDDKFKMAEYGLNLYPKCLLKEHDQPSKI